MNAFALFMAVALLFTLIAGMIRVVLGPTSADRMLSAQIFGTTGVAILLLLAKAWESPSLVSVALVFALLSAVVGVTFVRRATGLEKIIRETDL